MKNSEHWLQSEKAEGKLWLFCLSPGISKKNTWAQSLRFFSCGVGGWYLVGKTTCDNEYKDVGTWLVLRECFFCLFLFLVFSDSDVVGKIRLTLHGK